MDALAKNSEMIRQEALRLGFDACGITEVTLLTEEGRHLKHWLSQSFHGSMQYMEKHFEKRINPVLLQEGARSVISVLLNYYSASKQSDNQAPVVSKYAYGKDYHLVIKKRLHELLHFIQLNYAPTPGRAFTDSAPFFDKAWAVKAGLGWIGKNCCLITPAKGSFFFIGSLLVNLPLKADTPLKDRCGSCRICIDACPTGALIQPYVLDARKCLSYLTIEHKGLLDTQWKGKLSNRVFGCDICQDVCPWNRRAVPHKDDDFLPQSPLLTLSREAWYGMDKKDFLSLFGDSALMRAGWSKIRHNLEWVLEDSAQGA
jgi:epoxyqueuosine reductase